MTDLQNNEQDTIGGDAQRSPAEQSHYDFEMASQHEEDAKQSGNADGTVFDENQATDETFALPGDDIPPALCEAEQLDPAVVAAEAQAEHEAKLREAQASQKQAMKEYHIPTELSNLVSGNLVQLLGGSCFPSEEDLQTVLADDNLRQAIELVASSPLAIRRRTERHAAIGYYLDLCAAGVMLPIEEMMQYMGSAEQAPKNVPVGELVYMHQPPVKRGTDDVPSLAYLGTPNGNLGLMIVGNINSFPDHHVYIAAASEEQEIAYARILTHLLPGARCTVAELSEAIRLMTDTPVLVTELPEITPNDVTGFVGDIEAHLTAQGIAPDSDEAVRLRAQAAAFLNDAAANGIDVPAGVVDELRGGVDTPSTETPVDESVV